MDMKVNGVSEFDSQFLDMRDDLNRLFGQSKAAILALTCNCNLFYLQASLKNSITNSVTYVTPPSVLSAHWCIQRDNCM